MRIMYKRVQLAGCAYLLKVKFLFFFKSSSDHDRVRDIGRRAAHHGHHRLHL